MSSTKAQCFVFRFILDPDELQGVQLSAIYSTLRSPSVKINNCINQTPFLSLNLKREEIG